MEYKELLFRICEQTDMEDRDDIIASLQFLAKEALKYHDLTMSYDGKLKELMSAKDYEEWTKEEAKRIFFKDVTDMEDGEFKDFALDNWEKITE